MDKKINTVMEKALVLAKKQLDEYKKLSNVNKYSEYDNLMVKDKVGLGVDVVMKKALALAKNQLNEYKKLSNANDKKENVSNNKSKKL